MSHDHGRRRYLLAKRSVDDRGRDRRVRDRLLAALPDRPAVVEAGPGAGLAPLSLREWGVAPARYRGVDRDPRVVRFARHLAPRALRRAGHDAVDTADGCRLDGAPVRFAAGDALAELPGAGADLLVAQSFLDLVPATAALDAVADAVTPGGLAYAPLTFDGVTLFRPSHPADAAVTAAFHEDIDAEDGRTSRAARGLLDALADRPERVLAVGASDWVVRPVEGAYRADEAHFLSCILGFVADAARRVDGGADWLATRREQLAAGELTYLARNLDLLWRVPG